MTSIDDAHCTRSLNGQVRTLKSMLSTVSLSILYPPFPRPWPTSRTAPRPANWPSSPNWPKYSAASASPLRACRSPPALMCTQARPREAAAAVTCCRWRDRTASSCLHPLLLSHRPMPHRRRHPRLMPAPVPAFASMWGWSSIQIRYETCVNHV